MLDCLSLHTYTVQYTQKNYDFAGDLQEPDSCQHIYKWMQYTIDPID